MEERLKQLFDFLITNRMYNHCLQEKFYQSVIMPYDTMPEKVIALLYNLANTQSQPRINSLAHFYRTIYKNIESLYSFNSFINLININKEIEINYNGLYQSMKIQTGWGNKTSALFTKSIFHLHNNHYRKDLRLWDDAPSEIGENDDLFVPADIVIISIFKKLDPSRNWNFETINNQIKVFYKRQDIEVWDDLWFWGFISQNGAGDNRIFEWNENKYWALKETDKKPSTIQAIKNKTEDFLSYF
jgi:hypothetical protein